VTDKQHALRRLGRLVEERRLALGRSQVEVAGTSDTYRRLRDGLPTRSQTWRQAEKALEWETFSIDKVLDGGDPVELPPTPTVGANQQRKIRVMRDLGRSLVALEDASDEVLEQAERDLERLLATLRKDNNNTT
jgi:hypothetical protein